MNTLHSLEIRFIVGDVDVRVFHIGLRPQLGVKEYLKKSLLLQFFFCQFLCIHLHLMNSIKVNVLIREGLLRFLLLAFKSKLATATLRLLFLLLSSFFFIYFPDGLLARGLSLSKVDCMCVPISSNGAHMQVSNIGIDRIDGCIVRFRFLLIFFIDNFSNHGIHILIFGPLEYFGEKQEGLS